MQPETALRFCLTPVRKTTTNKNSVSEDERKKYAYIAPVENSMEAS
jgi:hypothetical protein